MCTGNAKQEINLTWPNENCGQKHLYDHYLSVKCIDKTDPSNPLESDQYWRHTLQTNAPQGLNIADRG